MITVHRTVAVLCVAVGIGCTPADRASIDTAAGDVSGRLDSAFNAISREYTEAELAGLLNAVNDAEVEMGNMIAPKATDPAVKSFAELLVKDHAALKSDVDALAKKLGISPTVPTDDEGLVESHRKAMTELGALPRGGELDEKFIEHEIDVHTEALDEVNDALGRNQNPDLTALLTKARTGLQAHLTAAEALHQKFQGVT